MYQFSLITIRATHYSLSKIIIFKKIHSKQSKSLEGRVPWQATENDNDASLTQSQEITVSTLFYCAGEEGLLILKDGYHDKKPVYK
jgi:hypothetical protein